MNGASASGRRCTRSDWARCTYTDPTADSDAAASTLFCAHTMAVTNPTQASAAYRDTTFESTFEHMKTFTGRHRRKGTWTRRNPENLWTIKERCSSHVNVSRGGRQHLPTWTKSRSKHSTCLPCCTHNANAQVSATRSAIARQVGEGDRVGSTFR